MHKAGKWVCLLMFGCASWAVAQQPLVPTNIFLPALKAPALGPAELPSFPANPQARTLGEHMESSNNNYAKFLEIYKNNKLRELAPDVESSLQAPKTEIIPPAKKTNPAQPSVRKAVSQFKARPVVPEPRIWYLSGIGNRITAELIYEKRVYRLDSSLITQRIGPWVLIGMDNKGVMLQLTDSPKKVWLDAPSRGQDSKDLLDAMASEPEPDSGTAMAALPKATALALPNAEPAKFSLPLVLPKP
jgi:hypothetical protein